jgi:hypothetical protein
MKSRRMRCGRACSTNGKKRDAYRIMLAKLEGKKLLGDRDVGKVKKVKLSL